MQNCAAICIHISWAASIRHLMLKKLWNFRNANLARNHHITWCQSACFKGFQTSCTEKNFWHFLAEIWPEKITSRDGCLLLISGSWADAGPGIQTSQTGQSADQLSCWGGSDHSPQSPPYDFSYECAWGNRPKDRRTDGQVDTQADRQTDLRTETDGQTRDSEAKTSRQRRKRVDDGKRIC